MLELLELEELDFNYYQLIFTISTRVSNTGKFIVSGDSNKIKQLLYLFRNDCPDKYMEMMLYFGEEEEEEEEEEEGGKYRDMTFELGFLSDEEEVEEDSEDGCC